MSNLFTATKINDLELTNRFVRSGTWMEKATVDGYITDELLAKYTELAKAKLGMVICGYARVMEDERANDKMIGMYNDEVAASFKALTDVFKANNTPVGIQIAMGGTQIHYQGDVKWKIYSPSAKEVKRTDSFGNELIYHVPEMTIEEIQMVQEKFVEAAVRVKNTGFDLVQIHAGHGYFLSQWMNPELNTRDDEYGQDRTKFIVELYEKMRNAVGSEMNIAIKLNSEEKIADHSNHDEMLRLCQILDTKGIDLIEVSGFAPSRMKVTPENESFFSEFTKKLVEVVDCKTMITGGNKTFKQIEKMQMETGVDYIGLSRPLISEPDLIKQWMEDEDFKMRCVSCNHCHRKTYTCVFDR